MREGCDVMMRWLAGGARTLNIIIHAFCIIKNLFETRILDFGFEENKNVLIINLLD